LLVVYPLRRWRNALLRIGRGRPRWIARGRSGAR
jgi:hypothetical protein